MRSSTAIPAHESGGLRLRRRATTAAAIGFVVLVLGGYWATVPAGCALPWDSMEQVERCGSARYRPDETNEGVIWVTSNDPLAIAGALGAAYSQREADVTQVFALPTGPLSVDGEVLMRTDKGYWAEWTEGILHFDVCTSWTRYDSTELCDDRLEFDVTR